MIAIIDYDAGNIKSVQKALITLGEDAILTRDREVLLNAEKVILPGVGAFEDAMTKIRSYGLEEVIKEIIGRGIPFLGICLGMQLLFERSEEGNSVLGLGILRGEILKIPADQGVKVPHIGWNSLHYPKKSVLFDGIEENAYVYFVHSFYLKAKEDKIVAATTEYATHIHAAIECDNLYACQFHPEKSSKVGLQVLKNFVQIGREGK